jgi:hypothetical protein
MRKYLVKENSVSKRVVDANSRIEAKTKTNLLSSGNNQTEALPPSSWSQSDFDDVLYLTRIEECGCLVCGKSMGKRELQYASNAYCGCKGGEQQ